MLRASFAVVLAAAAFVAAQLAAAAAPPEPHRPELLDLPRGTRRDRARRLEPANAALAGDKRLLWHPAGDAFVMLPGVRRQLDRARRPGRARGRSRELAWAFRELVDRRGGRTVFYQVDARRPPNLPRSRAVAGQARRGGACGFGLKASRARARGATPVAPPERRRAFAACCCRGGAALPGCARRDRRNFTSLGAFSTRTLPGRFGRVVRAEGTVRPVDLMRTVRRPDALRRRAARRWIPSSG